MRNQTKLFNLKVEPGEKQVTANFRKQTGPESNENSAGFKLRIKGGNKAVTAFIDEMNKVDLIKDEE